MINQIEFLTAGMPAWGFSGPGWYFWAEDEATCVGPYPTQQAALRALENYEP